MYPYQIIHYSMQQVFIWSQLILFLSNLWAHPSVIGHNSFFINQSLYPNRLYHEDKSNK